ncbi:2'-deoxycytidine 5'-triphosphate deaminase, partial [bacterium]|nr:2'-deoxycytidine 5'-triphosphate deaminase [bacterium]
YIIPLQESPDLPPDLYAKANPKSSTGRLDIFTRTITDYGHRFEEVRAGYSGPLYIEVFPRSFPVRVQTGLSLNQLRVMKGTTLIQDDELMWRAHNQPLLYDKSGEPMSPDDYLVEQGLFMGIDLEGRGEGDIIGWRARHHTEGIDLSREDEYDRLKFWEPIRRRDDEPLILMPEAFYLFAGVERVRIPADLSAEMIPYDTSSGELRTHYAGFFDSGFGMADPPGAHVVLEVRSHDVPFRLTHGQTFFRLMFHRNSMLPDVLYGNGGSHYQSQALALSKHFRRA